MNAATYYEEKIRFYTAAVQRIRKKIVVSSVLRFVAFAGILLTVYYYFIHHSQGLLLASLLFTVLFIVLVRRAFALKDEKALLEKLLFINENEAGVLQGKLNQLDSGEAFRNEQGYTADLDIFGNGSLYHLLNRCTTAHGKERLSNLLREPLLDTAEIALRQEAVKALSQQPDKRHELTAYGLLNEEGEGNLHSVTTWLNTPARLHRQKWLQVARWLIPLYNIPFFLLYIANGDVKPLLIGVGTGWLITGFYAKYIHRQHLLLSKKQAVLNQYANILRSFRNVDTNESALLKSLKQSAGNAGGAIAALSRLSSMFDQRLNLLVNLFLNSLILYDLQCILSLEKWKLQSKDDFAGWLLTVGDIECLNSLAALAYNNPGFAYPQVKNQSQVFIEARQLAHPLIAATERVANDFKTGKNDRLLLVTGSNMSGKTTFLRTLGVNLILAQNGAPVCAASFACCPMDILTSIRVSDSLQEHTSYFMAELKKLHQIIQQLQNGKPALVLIDEILRGTNSEDKTHGSEAFIKQLVQYNCLTLFATHDLMLSALENEYPGVVSNYCFESVIRDGNLYFDYTLQKGVAKNRNATFLMKKMGIIHS
ncbi:MAG: MutS-related protein [Agriterribacter sp.]